MQQYLFIAVLITCFVCLPAFYQPIFRKQHNCTLSQILTIVVSKKMKSTNTPMHINQLRIQTKNQTRLGFYLFVGMVLWLLNPGIHSTLVYESPCAPHFTSSLFLPCEGFKDHPIPWLNKVPFILIEYYLTTVIFSTLSFNWAIIFLGLSWVVAELKELL